MKCGICGTEGDLFSAVTRQPACSICVLTFQLRTPVVRTDVLAIRKELGLEPGHCLEIDRAKAAALLLGRAR